MFPILGASGINKECFPGKIARKIIIRDYIKEEEEEDATTQEERIESVFTGLSKLKLDIDQLRGTSKKVTQFSKKNILLCRTSISHSNYMVYKVMGLMYLTLYAMFSTP